MGKITDVLLPDIGDFDAVEVIEVLVSTGDQVAVEDSLITLESDARPTAAVAAGNPMRK